MPTRSPGFPFPSINSILFSDRLKRAGLSTGLPFLVQLDVVRRSLEACRSVRRASLFFVHVVPVPFDSTHVSFQVSWVVLQQSHQSCALPQGMFMRCVLHATEARNLLQMRWCLPDDDLQKLTQSREETSLSLADNGLDDSGSL